MYIEKVLNNNAFISLDENGDEIIVMGKGIAFGKKGNQKVDLTNLNYKIFSCKNKNINNKLISIVSDLSQEYILLTRKIISTFEKEYNKNQFSRSCSQCCRIYNIFQRGSVSCSN